MADEDKPGSSRKPRADAQRNRDLLLETAKAAFAEKGSDASLDEIARAAGVGAGTLYRHFPTRDALIAAVYRNETEQLVSAADRLTLVHDPVTALREWLVLFVDYLSAKRGMSEALNSIVGGTSDLYATSRSQLKYALGKLIGGAVASGDIQPVSDSFDLLRALTGVATISSGPHSKQAAKQFVDVLISGIRIPNGRGVDEDTGERQGRRS